MTNGSERVLLRTLSPEQRQARADERREDGERALREYAAAQKAFHANRERLKAERMAREAAERAKRQSTPT